MGDFKGTGIVYARKLAREQGEAVEQALVGRLSAEEAALFQTTMAGSWVPIDKAAKILDATAAACFPGDARGLWRVGHGMANDNLKGIYRMLVKLTTVPFLMKQTATLWGTYHTQGRAHTEGGANKNMTLVVEGYPGLPDTFREVLCGYVAASIELTGAKDVKVSRRDGAGGAWFWDARWT